jgi:hypothetical protein
MGNADDIVVPGLDPQAPLEDQLELLDQLITMKLQVSTDIVHARSTTIVMLTAGPILIECGRHMGRYPPYNCGQNPACRQEVRASHPTHTRGGICMSDSYRTYSILGLFQ